MGSLDWPHVVGRPHTIAGSLEGSARSKLDAPCSFNICPPLARQTPRPWRGALRPHVMMRPIARTAKQTELIVKKASPANGQAGLDRRF